MHSTSTILPSDVILDFANLSEGQIVLDVGPGRTGHVLFSAAKRVGVLGKVIGIDISRETLAMLEGLRRQYLLHHVDFLWMDVEAQEEIPLAHVDVVFLVNTAWMLRTHGVVLKRISRVLGAGGKLVIVDWKPDTRSPLAPRWDFRIDPRQLDIALAYEGLRVVARSEVTSFHWARAYQPF